MHNNIRHTMTTNTRNHTLYETEKKYKHIMTESMKNKNDIYPNLTVSLSKREKSRHTTIDILRPLNAQKTTNNVEHITMFESS